LSSNATREPGPVIGVLEALSAGRQMEDLENRLTGMGYRRVRPDAGCWQVSRLEATPARPVCSPSRPQNAARNRMLRFWLDRLGDLDLPAPYVIRRVED
jgi:hypothetical protein